MIVVAANDVGFMLHHFICNWGFLGWRQLIYGGDQSIFNLFCSGARNKLVREADVERPIVWVKRFHKLSPRHHHKYIGGMFAIPSHAGG